MVFIQVICQNSPLRIGCRRNGSEWEPFLQKSSLACWWPIIGMVHCMDDQFFLHSDSKDSITFFEFFVPGVIGICVRKFKVVFDTLTASKDD